MAGATDRRAGGVDGANASRAAGFVGVTLAGVLGNALSYLLLLVAARKLSASGYSELVTLLNILLIGYVVQLALQAVTARRVAARNSNGLARATLVIAAVCSVLLACVSPVLVDFLHLSGAWAVLMVAASVPGIAVQGVCQGIWQGLERFHALALSTFLGIFGRSAAGLVALLWGASSTTTLAVIAAGVTVAAVASLLATPHALRAAIRSTAATWRVLGECLHASHAYAAFLTLSATDLLLARHTLVAASAAVYAAGSVLTRIALWLPQSVANVLFASLTDPGKHRGLYLRAVSALVGLGVVMVCGAGVLRTLVTSIVSGDRYPALTSDIWLFAALGACLAITQFTLAAGLAQKDTLITILLWLAVAAEALAVLQLEHPSVRSIVVTVTAINLGLATAAVLLRIAIAHSARIAAARPVNQA